MNLAKLQAAERGLSVLGRKVLEVLSYSDTMRKHDVVGALKRANVHQDFGVLSGCLDTLVGDGLVKEPKPGEFIRIRLDRAKMVKPPILSVVTHEDEEEMPKELFAAPKAEATKPDALARLAAAADAVRSLQAQLAAVVSSIEDVALEVTEEADRVKSELAKIEVFKAALKGLA